MPLFKRLEIENQKTKLLLFIGRCCARKRRRLNLTLEEVALHVESLTEDEIKAIELGAREIPSHRVFPLFKFLGLSDWELSLLFNSLQAHFFRRGEKAAK